MIKKVGIAKFDIHSFGFQSLIGDSRAGFLQCFFIVFLMLQR